MIRMTAFLLALLMMTSIFVSCSDTGNKDGDDVATTLPADGEEATKLPELDWEGQEYRILARDSDWAPNFEIYRDELPEDVVGKAVFERNMALSEKYGITIAGRLSYDNNGMAKTMLESGEDLFDLTVLSPEKHHPLAMQGYLLDIYSLDYVNVEHDGWQDYANEQLEMGGKLYYTTNKILLQDKHRSWMLYYNRDLANELKLGYFEDWVFDGTWTIDKVIEMSKAVTADIDGVQGLGVTDRWGVVGGEGYNFCQWAFGVGFRFTEKDNEGYAQLIGATDRVLAALDKTYALTGNRDVYYCETDYGSHDGSGFEAFCDGGVVVYASALSALEQIPLNTDMMFGVLPNPKYDEKQENYYCIPNLENGSLLSVPATISDVAFAGFGLQALTEEALTTSYVAYIETKCKLQDVYDEDAAKCLDIIFNGVVYDIAFICDIGGLGKLMWSQMSGQRTNTYARTFKSSSKIATKQMDEIKATYKQLDY